MSSYPRNFYELPAAMLMDFPSLLKLWEEEVLQPKVFGNNQQRLQQLAQQIQQLWKLFNTKRKSLDKYYIDDANIKYAYLAAFFLNNIQRVYTVCQQRENLVALQDCLEFNIQSYDELHIADVGSGPLSAALGVIAVLQAMALNNAKFKLPSIIHIHAVERSKSAFQTGMHLVKKSLSAESRTKIRFTCYPSVDKLPEKMDVVLCVNVLNEIPVRYHAHVAEQMLGKMSKKSFLLLLEPGQDVHSKNLGILRDYILHWTQAKGMGLNVISPCMHHGLCPLSAHSNRKDWCWFQTKWHAPELLQKLDTLTKLDHSILNYSYVTFSLGLPKFAKSFARVISAPISLARENRRAEEENYNYARQNLLTGNQIELQQIFQGGTGYKAMLCTQKEDLQAFYYSENQDDNKRASKFARGSTVAKVTDIAVRVKERFTVTVPVQEKSKSKKPS